MISTFKITEIFCSIDDFCKEFVPFWQKSLIANCKKRIRKSRMSLSEVMTIQVLFQISGYRTFKDFYVNYVREHLQDEFPDTVSYNRMVELKKNSFMPLAIYLKTCGLANCTGISFVDSTPLRVCDKRRINQHKVFKGFAQRGQCSLGWFYGFKLHIVTNDQGGIIDFMITKGNVDDRKPLRFKAFVKKLYGKLFGDKGYISKDLFTELFASGIHLVTKLRKNMKTKLLTPMQDAYHLRKRAIIETIIDQLKNICQVEHSRHRSQANYFNSIFAALIAYNFKDKKPSLKNKFVDTKQLYLTL
jgi:hypothetical protein